MGTPHSDDDERVALLALLEDRTDAGDTRRRYAAWWAIASQVARCGSAIAVWNERHPLTFDGLGEADAALQRARARLVRWRAAGFDLVTVLDGEYPVPLRRIQHVPPVLFVTGRLCADDAGVSVVGSRDASSWGRGFAADIARGLVERGICVMSGLAAGIDTTALQATLAAGGRPIGVLGTGITRSIRTRTAVCISGSPPPARWCPRSGRNGPPGAPTFGCAPRPWPAWAGHR
jgi:DNA processing protein